MALQLGFQRGGALQTAGTASLLTNALPIAAGIALFGEALPGGALGALRVTAFTLVTAGAAVLARRSGAPEERRATRPPEPARLDRDPSAGSAEYGAVTHG